MVQVAPDDKWELENLQENENAKQFDPYMRQRMSNRIICPNCFVVTTVIPLTILLLAQFFLFTFLNREEDQRIMSE